MSDDYKGESPTKKFARLSIWEMMGRFHVSENALDRGNVLVLGSREAGDVSYLVGAGMDPRRIWAADMNAEACAAVRNRFPKVNVLHGDVADLCKDKRLPRFNTVFLDFCGPAGPMLLRTFHLVLLRKMAIDGVATLGVMRGRERGVIGENIKAEKQNCDFLVETGERDPRLPDMSRGAAIDRWLIARVAEASWPYLPMVVGTVHYHSRTAAAGGVPMYMRIFRVKRNEPRVRPALFGPKCQKDWHSALAKSAIPGVVEVHDIVNQADDVTVRKMLLEMVTDGFFKELPNPEMLLNVSKSTLAAWKAHATRGTYEAAE